MKSFAEVIGMIIAIAAMVVAAFAIASLPFAFLGWILLSAVALFTPVAITYMSSVVLGLAVCILGAIFT